eukprot:GHUV01023026.1.p1 GENE.GHUV01023026.1~~GHUV01023026.1.p1  ORF type:complete len:468 (+),score=135.06 GHUV01023026.1:122-1525(+)
MNAAASAAGSWPCLLGCSQSCETENLKILVDVAKISGIRSKCAPLNLVPTDDPPTGFSTSFEAADAESRTCMVAVVQQVLDKSGVTATGIDILVTTGSTFHPVPSLASMLVNHFKMRPDVKSYHLGCMACAAGSIGINLVHDLLKANPKSTALFVAHENVTAGFYTGSDPSRLLANGLFGMGAAALLLTNKHSLAKRAKYQLLHTVRVHVGQDDSVYRSMGTFESDEQHCGNARIRFNQDVPLSASKAIRAAVAKVAPKVLTWTQLAKAVRNIVTRRIRGKDATPPYLPSFAESTIDHFLLHPGSHGLLKGFMKGLQLTVDNTLPSAAALRDYGNTSCASTYYVLAYLESLIGIKKGERLLQISVGTGVKAGVNVWQAMHNIKEAHSVWDHLKGVPVREADLVLPLQLVSSVDDHAEVAKLLAEGRQLKQMPAVQLKQMPTAAVQLKEVPAEMGEWKDTDMARDNIV